MSDFTEMLDDETNDENILQSELDGILIKDKKKKKKKKKVKKVDLDLGVLSAEVRLQLHPIKGRSLFTASSLKKGVVVAKEKVKVIISDRFDFNPFRIQNIIKKPFCFL